LRVRCAGVFTQFFPYLFTDCSTKAACNAGSIEYNYGQNNTNASQWYVDLATSHGLCCYSLSDNTSEGFSREQR
jgi:hypothetical protein